MKYYDFIPKSTRFPTYSVNVSWDYLKDNLEHYANAYVQEKNLSLQEKVDLMLNPDFQRGHVWTQQQQIEFVEACFRGSLVNKQILFNVPQWNKNAKGNIVLVDGKQRINAVLCFLNDEFRVFKGLIEKFPDGLLWSDFLANDERLLMRLDFVFSVNDLPTKKDVLKWYLELNATGTPHTNEELARVQEMIDNEESN